MYYLLLSFHSLIRWFVLFSLLLSLYMALKGLVSKRMFSPLVNTVRHWTATIAHIQLMMGITIYFQSPVVKYAALNTENTMINDGIFFRYLHISLMFIAVVFITIGSAKAKRMTTDAEKYRTMLRWFTAGLIVILLAIPWPFYEYVSRPLIRRFQ